MKQKNHERQARWRITPLKPNQSGTVDQPQSQYLTIGDQMRIQNDNDV
jgi:hypothetical protein